MITKAAAHDPAPRGAFLQPSESTSMDNFAGTVTVKNTSTTAKANYTIYNPKTNEVFKKKEGLDFEQSESTRIGQVQATVTVTNDSAIAVISVDFVAG